MSFESEIKLEERKYWYENGQLFQREFYRNGKRDGECRFWHINGHLCEQEFYRNGKREGKRKIWYVDGKLRNQEFYRNGKLEGEYKSWENSGTMISAYRINKRGIKLDRKMKYALLNLKRKLYFPRIFPVTNSYIIFDLSKIIHV